MQLPGARWRVPAAGFEVDGVWGDEVGEWER